MYKLNWKKRRLTKLSELTIGDDQHAECSKTLQCLISMLFGGILINGSTWEFGISATDLLGLPDEILQNIALVLGQKHIFRLLHNVAEVGNQGLSLGRKLLGRVGHWARLQETVECNIDLLILRNAS